MNPPPPGSPIPEPWRTASYDYSLPEGLVAQEPAKHREGARLLVVPRSGDAVAPLRDATIPDLEGLLGPGDLLVVNETRVIPARLEAIREETGGKAEVLLLEHGEGSIRLMLGTRGKPSSGEAIVVAAGALSLVLEENEGEGVWRARTAASSEELRNAMERHGHVPLPPYIRREDRPDDRERYQTVFARHDGAVAAPTAGLHLTPELLHSFEANGVARTAVTLHVGPGTFRPVLSDDLRAHPMHEERFEVSPEAASTINACRERGGRIVAVGTTVVRVLESAVGEDGHLAPGPGRTSLFIHPPWTFRLVDALLTNFHAPRSTLLMLVAAFATKDRIMEAYAHAVRERYRLLSYGDAMFLA